MQKLFSYCLPLALALILIGCMDDPITAPQVKARLVERPQGAYLQSVTSTTNVIARWNPSLTDTQANFKGYYIQLFRSVYDSLHPEFDSLIEPFDAEAHTSRKDTSYIFTGRIPGQRYSVQVWGERYPDAAKPDSLILSKDYASASFDFDPQPVIAPLTLSANSNGQQAVNLSWSLSPSVGQKGLKGYVIRYRDNSSSKSKIYSTSLGLTATTKHTITPISLPLESSSSQISEFRFWIKAIRNDSTESADSTSVTWSGAYRVPANTVPSNISVGKKIFIGQTNTSFDLQESDAAEAQITVDTSSGVLVLRANNGAKFATTIDVGRLDSVYYTKPLDDSAYTESQITFPSASTKDGFVAYVLFAEGSRARVFIANDPLSGMLLAPNMKIAVVGSYQPKGPFNLHYY